MHRNSGKPSSGPAQADAAIQKHIPGLMPAEVPEIQVPHSDWLDEGKIKTALKDSSRRTLLGHSHFLGI